MDRRRWTGMGGAALTLALLAGLAPRGEAQQAPDIPFAPRTDPSLRDPDNPAKTFRVDFARVEHEFPLSRADLIEDHAGEYRRPDPGGGRPALRAADRRTDPRRPVPGRPLLRSRGNGREARLRTRLEEILGGIHGRVAGRSVEFIEELGRRLWKGKVFYRDERILRNMIENVVVLRRLIDDVDSVRTAAIPRESRIGRALGTDRSGCCSRRSFIAGRASSTAVGNR